MFEKTKRIKNKKLMRSYEYMACLVCNLRLSCAAHAKSQGSGGDDVKENLKPLCKKHHSEEHNIGSITFAEKYQSVMNWYLSNGWELVNIFGKKKFLRR